MNSDILCKYKDIFGKPKEGVHSYRLFNIAMFDFLGTILIAFIISLFFTSKYSFFIIFLILFLLGMILHYIFCVKTTINNYVTYYINYFTNF